MPRKHLELISFALQCGKAKGWWKIEKARGGGGGAWSPPKFKGGGWERGLQRAARLIPHYVCPRRAPRAREVSEQLYMAGGGDQGSRHVLRGWPPQAVLRQHRTTALTPVQTVALTPVLTLVLTAVMIIVPTVYLTVVPTSHLQPQMHELLLVASLFPLVH